MVQEIVQRIPLERLTTAPQVRRKFDEAEIRGLAATMKEVGQLQPIRCRQEGEKLLVEDGERRLRAARLLGWTSMAVIVDETSAEEATVVLRQLVANCQKSDLAPLEKADAIARLMEAGRLTALQAAAKLGLSGASVSKLLALRSLPEKVRQAVDAGQVPASAAYELTRIEDAERRAAVTEQLLAGTLTRDGAAAVGKRSRAQPTTSGTARTGRTTAQLTGERAVSISAPELSLERLIEILEELLGKARRARTQGFELTTFTKMLRDQAREAQPGN